MELLKIFEIKALPEIRKGFHNIAIHDDGFRVNIWVSGIAHCSNVGREVKSQSDNISLWKD